eukprot:13478051-Alexandrium_andersonii.AAC.1
MPYWFVERGRVSSLEQNKARPLREQCMVTGPCGLRTAVHILQVQARHLLIIQDIGNTGSGAVGEQHVEA